jgi:hypothetical protein
VRTLIKCSLASFLWGFFQWFYTAGDDCGFGHFPALGLVAYQNRYLNPSLFFFYFAPSFLLSETSNQPLSESAVSILHLPVCHMKTIHCLCCCGVARFYFDFSTTYIGAGMICPHIVNVSVLLGGILSWGVLWPLIAQKRGSWFDAELADTSLEGMQGYRVLCHLLSNVS